MLLTPKLDVFDKQIEVLECKPATKAYIGGIFTEFLSAEHIPKNNSLTIVYAEAKFNYDFEKFRTLADWIFFVKTLYPDHLSSAEPTYYNALAQSSYYKCHIIMNKKWPLFEEMADRFSYFVGEISKGNLTNLP